jgi:signal transduction histidine kinase
MAAWALFRTEDGRPGTVRLPHTFRGLPPRAKVELLLNLEPQTEGDDSLLMKSFYSPLRVYADGDLLFERGGEGDYPAFLKDPPTTLSFIRLPENTRQLRLEYRSPTQRGRLDAQPIFIGNNLALYSMQFRKDFISFTFSLVLLFFGNFIILLAFFLMRGVEAARSLFWLGLLALTSALWGIGECDFTLLLIPYPTLLYLMAFSGLYFIPMPFLMYGLSIVKPVVKWPVHALAAVHAVCLILAVTLQALGRADLSGFTPQMHFLIMACFAGFFVTMMAEHKKYGTRHAARFAVSTLILILFCALEILNYWLRFAAAWFPIGLIFHTGMQLFALDLGLIGGRFIKESIAAAREKNRLEAEMGFVSMILDERRGQYARLMESSRRDAAARHNFRHQIATLRDYCDRGNTAGLEAFLGQIAQNIHSSPAPVCENFAVNAATGHYFAMARENRISLDVRLNIPQSVGRVHDLDLCVMVGNLLENAVEACQRQGTEPPCPRFINVTARTRDGTLTLVVENGFDGLWQKRGDAYLSRKRLAEGEEPQPGLGISSVREICRRYDGLLKFDVSENVWRTSALLDLTGRLKGAEQPPG